MSNRGTQIAYIPNHANGDINHPDVEFGFITSEGISEETNEYHCRFWSKKNPDQLRTLSCSELTDKENIVVYESKPQKIVDSWLKRLGYF